MSKLPFWVGSYTNNNQQDKSYSAGILPCEIDLISGKLFRTKHESENNYINANDPSFVVRHDKSLYTVLEACEPKKPQLLQFSLDSNHNQTLHPLTGDAPCHLDISEKWGLLATAHYMGGNYEIFKFSDTDLIHTQSVQATGSSINLERQTEPHAHQVTFLHHTPQMVTVDLGTDEVTFYPIDTAAKTVSTQNKTVIKVTSGFGPRHLVFNQDETTFYLLNELSEVISNYQKSGSDWHLVQEVPLLPNQENKGAAAAIKLSPDGRFLYASARAQSRIVCYSISKNGELSFVDDVSSQGDFPRDFEITPCGNWLIAANQHSHNLASYKRDLATGKLTPTGFEIESGSPVCVSF